MQIASQLNLSAPANSDAERQLREFAQSLAKTHRVERASFKKSSLVEHLKSWEQALRNANAILKTATSTDVSVSRASEWMLDNFYIVSQTFRQIEEDLPARYLNQLPRLDGTALKGLPRIFRAGVGMDRIQPVPTRPDPSGSVCARVPEGHPSDNWRTMGHPDHAANRDIGAARLRKLRTDRLGSAEKPEPGACSRTPWRILKPVRFPGVAKRYHYQQLFYQPAPALCYRLERLL